MGRPCRRRREESDARDCRDDVERHRGVRRGRAGR